MIMGMILSLFIKFLLPAAGPEVEKKRCSRLMFIFIKSGNLLSQAQTGIGAGIPAIDRGCKNLSELWVQGVDGRIEPVSTLSCEIVRKFHKSSSRKIVR
jgi:hypothetical protein